MGVVSIIPWLLLPQGKSSQFPMDRRLVGQRITILKLLFSVIPQFFNVVRYKR
jgi:hypothetical protein